MFPDIVLDDRSRLLHNSKRLSFYISMLVICIVRQRERKEDEFSKQVHIVITIITINCIFRK